jgi:MFS family permease
VADVLTPTILTLTAFFALISLSNSGMQNFLVVTLMATKDITFTGANAALTAFLFAGALGVLSGGALADKTRYHGEVAAIGFGLTALIVLIIALLPLSAPVVISGMGLGGFLAGMIMPSRDMLVRKAAAPGAEGRVFAIVSTGFMPYLASSATAGVPRGSRLPRLSALRPAAEASRRLVLCWPSDARMVPAAYGGLHGGQSTKSESAENRAKAGSTGG